MIGDLSSAPDTGTMHADIVPLGSVGRTDSTPFFSMSDIEAREYGLELRLTNREEDALLKDTTGSFADWVTSLIRRVIQLLENLPEEDGNTGGASEGMPCLSKRSSLAADLFINSETSGCRGWRLQSYLLAPFRAIIWSSAQHNFRICNYYCSTERCASYSSASRMRCQRESC